MPPIVLKISGNESFLPFSNLDQEELSKTWRVCTKVKDSLENGSRLENLSWRLWFIQNVLVSNDVKSKKKKNRKHTAAMKKMEIDQELEPTKTTVPTTATAAATTATALNKNSNVISPQEQQSVLDYSLDEIKTVLGGGTENFILNQFTSDQEGNQMIELTDIFPFNMQGDFMYNNNTTISQQEVAGENPPVVPASGNQIYNDTNTSSWQPPQQQPHQYYNQTNAYSSSSNLPSYNSTANVSPITSPYPTATNNYIHQLQQQNYLAADPISGIHTLFSDTIHLPPTASTSAAMNIPVDMMNPYNQQQQQEQNLIVDFNNAAYVAAAAAATAAALTTLPNATLHNKLLATLPKQTLASAERLLSPANQKRPSIISTQQQKMNESLPSMSMSRQNQQQQNLKKHAHQQHYYSTFQLDTSRNSDKISTPTTATTVIKNKCEYNASPPNANNPSSNLSDENPPQCSNCDATSTPLWRRSTDDKILCNACGLYLKLHNTPRPRHLKPSGGKSKLMDNMNNHEEEDSISDNDNNQSQQTQTICSNCGTNKTPLWRRDVEGLPLCNACGLYLKLHNEKRPLSMKTDVIKKRQRTETLLASTSSSSSGSENDQSKKPRYYDQQSLYNNASEKGGTTFGYKNAASSLPGTGILMMTSAPSPPPPPPSSSSS